MRTGVFVENRVSERRLLDSLGKGFMIVTDGPVARVSARAATEDSPYSDESVRGETVVIDIEALSSPEFGEISSMKVIVGKTGESSEKTAVRFDGCQGFSLHKQVAVKRSASTYVRVEVWTSSSDSFDDRQHLCLTNPIWISPPH